MKKKFMTSLAILASMTTTGCYGLSASSDNLVQKKETLIHSVSALKEKSALRIGVVDVASIVSQAPQMKRLNAVHTLELDKNEEDSKKIQAMIEQYSHKLEWLSYQQNTRVASFRAPEEQFRRERAKLIEKLAENDRKKIESKERRDKAKMATLSEWVKKVVEARQDPLDMVLVGATSISAQEGAVLYFNPSEQLIDLTEEVVKIALRSSDIIESDSDDEDEAADQLANVAF